MRIGVNLSALVTTKDTKSTKNRQDKSGTSQRLLDFCALKNNMIRIDVPKILVGKGAPP